MADVDDEVRVEGVVVLDVDLCLRSVVGDVLDVLVLVDDLDTAHAEVVALVGKLDASHSERDAKRNA